MSNETPGERNGPVARSFVSQGLALNFFDWGNQGAPVLLLVHGIRDHARSWDWVALGLRDRFQVLALDLRGHGDSAWSPDGAYMVPYHTLDLVEMIERLGVERLSLLGHSYGGGIVSRYAGMYPGRVEKLVLVDGLGPSPTVFANWQAEGAVRQTRDWVARRRAEDAKTERHLPSLTEAAARMMKANTRLSADQAAHLALHGARLEDGGYRWKFDPRVSMFTPEDFRIPPALFWREVTAPVLLVHGVQSWAEGPDSTGYVNEFRDRQLATLDGAGHWPHHDRVDAFVGAVGEFL